jgi:hypothetical protein
VVAREDANLRSEIAEEKGPVYGDLTAFSELPAKQHADTVLLKSPLVISPPVSLGNDTLTITQG